MWSTLAIPERWEPWLDHNPVYRFMNAISGIVHKVALSVETLNDTVDEELAALPEDMQARFVRIAELIEAVGLTQVKEPHVKHVRGPLWEIRLKGKAGIARALYVTAIGQRVVVVRVFMKKTEETPSSEIDLALERAKELHT